MAPRKRQVQSADATNGKPSPVKGVAKHKHGSKSRDSDESSPISGSTSLLYKIALVSMGWCLTNLSSFILFI